MASLSFRDRFFSPPVARALTSPSAILSLGAGAAVGVLVTIGTGGVAAPVIGAFLGGALGLGGRVAVALPRASTAERIDPFAVNEPWRQQVIDAVRARSRFTAAVASFPHGPLKEAVSVVSARLDEAVQECWKVAKQGDLVAEGRKRINDTQIRNELSRAQAQSADGTELTDTKARTIASLNAQLASGLRMDTLMSHTFDELSLLNAQLDEAVTQAIELSVTNSSGGFAPVSSDVAAIVGNLTELRHAMGDLDSALAPGVQAQPGVAAQPDDEARPAGASGS